jgi:predicted NBD/HSP70 family sugar kinase
VRELARTVDEFRQAHPRTAIEGMGVSLPGRVDAAGCMVFAPNLAWPPVDLKELLESTVGLPVVLENAANACALAEVWFGRHPDHVKNLVAVGVSEGIGVGLLMNGQLVRGAEAMAGEFGHVTLDENGPPCACGKRGCWERYASNTAATRYYDDLANRDGASAPGAIRYEELMRLALAKDRRAGEALDRQAEFLGKGLAALQTGLAPEVIVVFGEVTGAWDRVGPIVADVVTRRSLSVAATRIVATDPDERPRLRGAVTLVVQQHFGAPDVA